MDIKYTLLIVNDHNNDEITFYMILSKFFKEYPKLGHTLEEKCDEVLVTVDNQCYISIDDEYIPCNYIGSGEQSLVKVGNHISNVMYCEIF